MSVVRALTDVDASLRRARSTARPIPVGHRRTCSSGRRWPRLVRLRFRNRLEHDPEPRVVRRHETDLVIDPSPTPTAEPRPRSVRDAVDRSRRCRERRAGRARHVRPLGPDRCRCGGRRATNRSTVSCWSSMDVLVRSRWMRFLPAFGFGTARNTIRNLVSSVGTRPISSPVSSSIAQCRASAQKRARRSGSFVSKHRATSRDVIGEWSPRGSTRT